MKKLLRVQSLFLVLLATANLSMNWQWSDWFLSEEDRFLEQNQISSALSSAINEVPQWESFNEWRCYSTDKIKISYVDSLWNPELHPDVWERAPAIEASEGEENILFDHENIHFTGEKYEDVISIWHELIDGERSVCIYAAYLEEIDETSSGWVIFGIKTSKGYWPADKSVFFSTSMQPQREADDSE